MNKESDFQNDTIIYKDNQEFMLNPMTGQYLPLLDTSVHLMNEYKKHKLTDDEKLFQKEFLKRRSEILKTKNDMPVPGGVGYGVMYKSAFQYNFVKGTSIAKTIYCPLNPGSGVTETLYLTSTNRAAKGVEALIWYNGNSTPSFWIYDWGESNPGLRFTFGIQYVNLGDYLTYKTIHGVIRLAIEVQNQSFYVDDTHWRNVVWLVNQTTGNWEQVYSNTYTASNADQKDSHYGSWGPTVETFQSSYGTVNSMGFGLTMLRGADASGVWSGFSYLSNSDSELREDSLGFVVDFIDANSSFCVHHD